MVRVAVILAEGFEEIEALTPVDVFRRAQIDCQMIGLTSQQVSGSHGITVQADAVFLEDLSDYDLIVLPGGMPGSANLRDHEGLIAQLQERAAKGAIIAAICAAPLVLEAAGLLRDKAYTCFPGVESQIRQGKHRTDSVVIDGNIITSRGVGTSLAFAYTLVDVLGGSGKDLAEKMVYTSLFE